MFFTSRFTAEIIESDMRLRLSNSVATGRPSLVQLVNFTPAEKRKGKFTAGAVFRIVMLTTVVPGPFSYRAMYTSQLSCCENSWLVNNNEPAWSHILGLNFMKLNWECW